MPRFKVTLERRIVQRVEVEIDAPDEVDATEHVEHLDLRDPERYAKLEWADHDQLEEVVDCEEDESQAYASSLSMALHRVAKEGR